MEQTVVARLKLELGNYLAGLSKAAVATKEFGKEVAGAGSASAQNVQAVGRASLLMAGAVAAGMGLAVKAAMNWETAWAGVTKTVSGTKSQMADLESGLRGLATTLPATHTQIAAVAEAAGQLGIQRDAIVGFTKTMVALGVSTNLTADEAATGIAKIANVMQTPQSEIDRFGATLVALGNVGASTESEILEMASRLAGAGKLVGASESDVLALANAMTSMGIEAQLGGGAFSRVMLKIFSATKSGGDKLAAFASVAGTSASKFAADFKKEPIQAIDGLVHGLDRIDKGGGNVIAVLGQLGFKGTQDLQVLLKLKGSGDLLAESLKLGSKAWQDNTALTKEAEKRYATAASQLSVLKNQVVDVGIKFGGVLLPALKATTGGINTMVTGFGSLPGVVREAAMGFGAVATAGLGVVGVVATLAPKIAMLKSTLSDMGSLGTSIATNLGTIGLVFGAAAAALAIYSLAVGQNAKEQAKAKAAADGYAKAIADQGASIGHVTDELAFQAISTGSLGTALRKSKTDLNDFGDALHATGGAGSRLRDGLRDLESTVREQGRFGDKYGLDQFIEQLKGGKLASADLTATLIGLARSGDLSAKDMGQLLARLREQNAALNQGAIEAKNKAAAEAASAATSASSASAADKVAAAYKAQATSADAATKAIKALTDAEHAALDPLFGMLDAAKANADAQAALAAALKEGGHSTAEISALQLTAAKSALDMDAAATTLAGSIAAGTVNVDVAKAQLQLWVEQGLISKQTAIDMGVKFTEAGVKADAIAGDRVIGLIVNDVATPILDMLTSKLAQLTAHAFVVTVAAITPQIPTAGFTGVPTAKPKIVHNAAGGWAGTGPMSVGPRGTDTIPTYLGHGEFVVNASAARSAGVALEQLNRTGTLGARAGTQFTGASTNVASMAPAGAPVFHVPPALVELHLGAGDRQLLNWLRKQVRIEGGNVQKVLGS